MKSILLIICFALGFCNSLESEKNFREYFKNTPYTELDAFTSELILNFNYSDSLLLGVDILKSMYPDSICDSINLDVNPCYAYGRYRESEEFYSVIVLREHGDWLKTLDLLSYNYNNELQSIIYLAGISDDGGYSFRGYGEFLNDSIYKATGISTYYEIDLLEDKVTSESYDSTVVITRFDNLGKIVNVEKNKYSR